MICRAVLRALEHTYIQVASIVASSHITGTHLLHVLGFAVVNFYFPVLLDMLNSYDHFANSNKSDLF